MSIAMCQTQQSSDLKWMHRALHLAKEMRGHVWPNPAVGCVLVKGDTIVAEAATHPGGRPHAERKALDQAGDAARDATLYVTLEPCCHWGKTPPCVDAIIEGGVIRVVCAVQDPDPRVNGGGFEKLRQANLKVDVGLCSADAARLMSGFFHRIQTRVPELVLVDEGHVEVPEGADALLISKGSITELFFRSGKKLTSDMTPPELMRWTGDLGLTSIAVPRDDLLAVQLANSGLLPMQKPLVLIGSSTAAGENSWK